MIFGRNLLLGHAAEGHDDPERPSGAEWDSGADRRPAPILLGKYIVPPSSRHVRLIPPGQPMTAPAALVQRRCQRKCRPATSSVKPEDLVAGCRGKAVPQEADALFPERLFFVVNFKGAWPLQEDHRLESIADLPVMQDRI